MVYGLVEEQRGATKKKHTVYQHISLFYSLNKTKVVWMIKCTKYYNVGAFDTLSGPVYLEKLCPE